ncbi:hypothetical protein F5144DRAFT_628047 [Chaetomium tenue]|uniref:Uncharacterized protein n=1 Tax=Chaetomium tenue TaxID=1854479 RepID=A0ACB7PA37_9PEZI|nr:hypothetical protein F5144DRAFT_628047 [Chaetomium globosum]
MASWNSLEITNEHLLPYLNSEDAPPEVKAGMQAFPAERNILKILGHSTANFPTFMKQLKCQWSPERKLRSSECDEQLAALKDPHTALPEALFSPRRRLIAQAIEELSSSENRIIPETLERMKAVFSTEEIVELLYMPGIYAFLGRLMRTVKIDSDGPIPGLEDTLRKHNAEAIEKEKQYKD